MPRVSRCWPATGLIGQPWCGGALSYWMQGAGIAIPKAYYRAKAWLDWGTILPSPVVGCVVVFDRKGGGHVGIVTGQSANGDLLVIGGNQNDAVRISAFNLRKTPALGYRWPPGVPFNTSPLPVVAGHSSLSTSEA